MYHPRAQRWPTSGRRVAARASPTVADRRATLDVARRGVVGTVRQGPDRAAGFDVTAMTSRAMQARHDGC